MRAEITIKDENIEDKARRGEKNVASPTKAEGNSGAFGMQDEKPLKAEDQKRAASLKQEVSLSSLSSRLKYNSGHKVRYSPEKSTSEFLVLLPAPAASEYQLESQLPASHQPKFPKFFGTRSKSMIQRTQQDFIPFAQERNRMGILISEEQTSDSQFQTKNEKAAHIRHMLSLKDSKLKKNLAKLQKKVVCGTNIR